MRIYKRWACRSTADCPAEADQVLALAARVVNVATHSWEVCVRGLRESRLRADRVALAESVNAVAPATDKGR